MMRLPPGVPRISTPRGPSTKVGDIDDSGRLPGATAFGIEPTSPYAFDAFGDAEKSSISSLRITPVPGTMKPEPNGRLIDIVAATRLPSASMIEKCDVLPPSPDVGAPSSELLGVARSGEIVFASSRR